MSNAPLVSVIIPAYKAAAFVSKAVDSILAQDHAPIEIIVVDDCSPDDTAGALAPYTSTGRVRLIRQERNQGVAAARNAGVRAATGQFIAFLDADDLWLPQHVSGALAVLHRHPELDVVMQDFDIRDMVTNESHGSWFDMRHEPMSVLVCTEVEPGCHRIDGDFIAALMVGCFVHVQATVSRRHVFERVSFDERLRSSEDLDWAVRSAHVGGARWAWMARSSGIYHRHANSLTTHNIANNEAIEKIGLMLFLEYLGWPGLGGKEKGHLRKAIVTCCLDLSYIARIQNRFGDAWRYLLSSFQHGVGRRQLLEGVKLGLASPAMIWRRRGS